VDCPSFKELRQFTKYKPLKFGIMKKIMFILLTVVAFTNSINAQNQNISNQKIQPNTNAYGETLVDIGQFVKDLGLDDFDFIIEIESSSKKQQPTIYSSDIGFEEDYLNHVFEMTYKTSKGKKSVIFWFDTKTTKPITKKHH
jgi:hypothetical protein